VEFADAVNTMILKLRDSLEEYVTNKEESKEEKVEGEDDGNLGVEDVYIRQIDYT
jgi:hypothetical protein